MSLSCSFFGTARNRLGESPLWDEARQCLWWIDAQAVAPCEGWIHAAHEDGTPHASWRFARAVGSIGLTENGLVAAMADGFYLVDERGEARQWVACSTHGGAIRFNDGKADRTGNFLAGQMELREGTTPKAALWCLSRNGLTHTLESGLRLANAICFSPDNAIIYFADSPEGCIRAHAYDADRGLLGSRIGAIDCLRFGSIPDGATVDSDGNLWVALVQSQAVVCLSPTGRLLHRVDMPVPFPSCPAFGGKDLDTLFVTTIADSGRYLRTDHPDAGRNVTDRGLGVRGIAERRWEMKTEPSE